MSVTNTTTSEPSGLLNRIFGRVPPPVVTVNIDLGEIRDRLDGIAANFRERAAVEEIARITREAEARVARETAIATQAEAERNHQAALAAMEERVRASTEQRARELAALAEQHARDLAIQQTALRGMRIEVAAALAEAREARKAAEEVIVEASASALGGVHELATRTAAVEELLPKFMDLVRTISQGHTSGNIVSHVSGDVVDQ